MKFFLILLFLISAGCSLDSGNGSIGFEKAEDILFTIRDHNIKLQIMECKTRKDVRKQIAQEPDDIKIISPPKKTKENEKKVRQMVYQRYDKYFFKSKDGSLKTVFIEYVRLKKNEKELDLDAKEFADDDWYFINFHVASKIPERFSRLTRKEGKPIPDSMKNPGDAPIAAGGGKPKKGDKKKGSESKPSDKKNQSSLTAEDIMKRCDQDKDGKLTGSEIPKAMKRYLNLIDTNKDGSISLSELKAVDNPKSRQEAKESKQ